MNKLKEIIKEYSRWSSLEEEYLLRIEAEVGVDFSRALENAKALLESICKEICKQNSVELGSKASINKTLRQAFGSLGYSNDGLVTQISSSLGTIGQKMAELRNEIGITAHGKTLDEARERNRKVDEFTKDFLIDSVEMISVFLIRAFESQNEARAVHSSPEPLEYNDCSDFNEYWDDSFGEFFMGEDYSYIASEILFNVDSQAYNNEVMAFKERQENEQDD